jgi:FMN phosphatase YigB (HAD superfamily)
VTSFAKPLPLEVVRNTARELDEVLTAGQEAEGIKANPIVDDPTFIRRSYLNIIGRLPTHDEARSFLESTEKGKRSQLIDSLVESPGFNSRLFNFWTDLLRVKTNTEHNGLGWHVWLKNAVENNLPYNEMVQEMLAAEGHIAKNPAAGYYLRDRGMLLDNVSNTCPSFPRPADRLRPVS